VGRALPDFSQMRVSVITTEVLKKHSLECMDFEIETEILNQGQQKRF